MGQCPCEWPSALDVPLVHHLGGNTVRLGQLDEQATFTAVVNVAVDAFVASLYLACRPPAVGGV